MFEVHARDGAARIARWTPRKGRAWDTPTVLWPSDELDEGRQDWVPRVERRPADPADLANTFSIQNDEDVVDSGGGLLLRRRLETPTIMSDSGAQLREAGRLSVLVGTVNLWRDPKRFAAAILRARTQAGYGRLLYTPGLGAPNDLALLAYCGVDVVDATICSYEAALGRFMTSDGTHPASSLDEPECVCPSCDGRPPASLDEQALRGHNQWAVRTEMARVRNAIRAGRLRGLVESRVRALPERSALLRRLDAEGAFFEQRAPVESEAPVLATTQDALTRPEVARFRNRVATRYVPPSAARFLLLLPCSARKPYGTSKSHRRFHDAMWRSGATSATEEWIVTSPLGVVPRSLERTYPAAHYDVPVTGQWDAVEATMIRDMLAAMLAKRPWDAVVVHLPASTLELVRPVLPEDAVVTCQGGGPSRGDNLDRLIRTFQGLVEGHERPTLSELLRERMLGVASYQFGAEAAKRILGDATVRGKWPGGKFFAEGKQLASLPINKGLLSFTLDGGRRMLEAGINLVEIDDFDVKGSVFAVGVRDADPAIRVGDEVVLHHAGTIKGVGVAAMAGPEMSQMERGEAVKVRHHA